MNATSLRARFRAALAAGGQSPEDHWLVAVSGGLDSVVLLHLLRFGAPPSARLTVAHFDHAMRAGSDADAAWVLGLAAAWGLRVRVGRASAGLSSEAQAREARYAFLDAARRESGARLVLTAHHADDQAETVLFRALRGTGRAGLAGMASCRGAVFRPLLAFWREELEAYARSNRLGWREDATNASLGYARNALRHVVLPDVERLVAPGARRALVRLADLAREDEAGWESILPGVLEPLALEERHGVVWANRAALAALHPAVRARVLRTVAARVGASLDEAATKRVVAFVATARSGQSVELGGGFAVRVELDRVAVTVSIGAPADRPLTIADVGPGAGRALLAGRDVNVAWGPDDAGVGRLGAHFDPSQLRFPLLVRARLPGDRMRLRAGGKLVTKKVKKLLLERRVPGPERRSVPLVVDAEGDVLWIPGVAHAPDAADEPGGMHIQVRP